MPEVRKGVIFAVSAYLMWGLFPLYWALLDASGALELLAQRVVWSLIAVGVIVTLLRGPGWWRRLRREQLAYLSVAAVAISINWGVFIYAVNHDHVLETSLGYFINPLVTILLGVIVLSERLRRVQWVAVGIAAVAVAVLTIGYGRLPLIALALAFSFGSYGLLKKKANVGALESLTVETGVMLIPALAYLGFLALRGESTFTTEGPAYTVLVISSGLITIAPLLCFGAAAIRVPLTTLGMVQYLAPIIQFLIGVFVFSEDIPPSRIAGFALVWTALAVLTFDQIRSHRGREMEPLPA